jgi:AraC-like DNA-binding protein
MATYPLFERIIQQVSRSSATLTVLPPVRKGRLIQGHPPLKAPTSHLFPELAICYEGRMMLVDGLARRHVLRAGDAALIQPGAWHYETYSSVTQSHQVCWFHTSGAWTACNYSSQRKGVFKVLAYCTVMLADGARTLEDLVREARSARSMWKLKLRLFLMELLVDFKRSEEKPPPASQVRNMGSVQKALRIAETRFAEPLRLQSVSREVGLSPNHLGHRIQATTEMSFHQYLNSIRIHQAQLLLRSGCPIKETADRCGFRDVYYFTKVFSHQCKISPGRFARLR